MKWLNILLVKLPPNTHKQGKWTNNFEGRSILWQSRMLWIDSVSPKNSSYYFCNLYFSIRSKAMPCQCLWTNWSFSFSWKNSFDPGSPMGKIIVDLLFVLCVYHHGSPTWEKCSVSLSLFSFSTETDMKLPAYSESSQKQSFSIMIRPNFIAQNGRWKLFTIEKFPSSAWET